MFQKPMMPPPHCYVRTRKGAAPLKPQVTVWTLALLEKCPHSEECGPIGAPATRQGRSPAHRPSVSNTSESTACRPALLSSSKGCQMRFERANQAIFV